MTTIDLKYRNADNGNCRVYYRGNAGLWCLQLDNNRTGEFGLYICSRDGEPESPVAIETVATIEAPTGDERIEQQLRDWLDGRRPDPLTESEKAQLELAEVIDGWRADIADAERKLSAQVLVGEGYILAHDATTVVLRLDGDGDLCLRPAAGHLCGVPHMTKANAEVAAKRWNDEMEARAPEYGVSPDTLTVRPVHYRDFLAGAVEKWREMIEWVESRALDVEDSK